MSIFDMTIVKVSILFLAFFVNPFSTRAQSIYKIMTYNLLNYPGSDSAIRNPYFRTIIASLQPDILVTQEVISQAGVNGFLNNVLNIASNGYSAGGFIDGPDTDNAIFFKSSRFTFLANNVITTSLRNISEFILSENSSGDTIRIYSVHLKAGSGNTEEQLRLAEVTALRNVTDALPLNSNFIVCGDFNIYGSNEPAYQKLKNQSSSGYFLDIYNLTGSWNNSSYAAYHTQSPRVRQFGGGSNGGLDDRFDLILMSQAVIDIGGINYVPGSYTEYGNDGQHYNDSINKPPNGVVSQAIANALHYATDHIPVYAEFIFNPSTPQLFSASISTNEGWSLVSFPGVHPNSMYKDTLYRFMDLSAGVFYFNGSYSSEDTIKSGKGYWIKHNDAEVYNWNGTVQNGVFFPKLQYPTIQSVYGNNGWNLVGVYDYAFQVSELTTSPPGLINGFIYGYSHSGYNIASMMEPGKAYWVNLSNAGQIIYPPRENLSQTSKNNFKENFTDGSNLN